MPATAERETSPASLGTPEKENCPPNSPTATVLAKGASGKKRSAVSHADDDIFTRGRKRPTMQIDLGRLSEGDLDSTEKVEHDVYKQLLALVPGLEEKLNTGSNNQLIYIADMITKGSSSARSNDTRSLKSAVIDWITPPNASLSPPLMRNVKTGRGFLHTRTGELLCPCNLDWNDPETRRDLASGQLAASGDQWPHFLYRGFHYDEENPWEGLFRSSLLVSAYKHVFTSPSSAMGDSEGVAKCTKSSNARIHGMKHVTIPSLAYIATQVRFALSSTATFSRSDTVTDSEYFYFLIIDLLNDPEEQDEVTSLLQWWNQQIFPTYTSETVRAIHKDSVLARIKERRRQLQDGNLQSVSALSMSGGQGLSRQVLGPTNTTAGGASRL
ncbi:hypothetical protein NMY22_g18974 [Coprinellus aureogranulatus]|nr:hypothetical protein NMY22_g18974 [Coprinellus aureogranulatus]